MFKKQAIIGINSFVHDTSACLVDYKSGKIIYASAEERYSNLKSDYHIPFYSISECFRIAKEKNYSIELASTSFDQNAFLGSNFYKKINLVIQNDKISNNFIKYLKNQKNFFNIFTNKKLISIFFERNNFFIDYFQKKKIYELLTYYYNSMIKYNKVNTLLKKNLRNIKLVNVKHHLAHAACVYFNSGFKNSNIIVIDGQGEEETISIFKAENNTFNELSTTTWPYSIGYFYQLATLALGYNIGDEYKVMGMSAYGKDTFGKYFKDCFKISNSGKLKITQNDFLKIKNYKNTSYERLCFTNKFLSFIPKIKNNNFTQEHFDFSKSVQKISENLGLEIANWAYNKNRTNNLCISGGCALNGLMNNNILNNGKYKNIYVFSASGDDGTAVGAAQYIVMQKNKFTKRPQVNSVFFGYEDNPISVNTIIKNIIKDNMELVKCDNVYKFIALELSKNKIIAIYNSRSEFGPRALGARSIIANPLKKNIQKELNIKIKIREPFRPFAPIVLNKFCKNFFELKIKSNFMLFICNSIKRYRKIIPGVIHYDGSARVQTVGKDNKVFYNILKEFKKITNYPILINTSFNIGGEAIVNDIEDAINSFNQMDIDYLFINNILIKKKYNSQKINISNFIMERKSRFARKIRFQRINLLRLNHNFYNNNFTILYEMIKDFFSYLLKKNYFIK